MSLKIREFQAFRKPTQADTVLWNVPSFESASDEGGDVFGGDPVKVSGEGGAASIDYDKLTGRLLDNRNFREAVAQGFQFNGHNSPEVE